VQAFGTGRHGAADGCNVVHCGVTLLCVQGVAESDRFPVCSERIAGSTTVCAELPICETLFRTCSAAATACAFNDWGGGPECARSTMEVRLPACGKAPGWRGPSRC
jgi:hypothetical protein